MFRAWLREQLEELGLETEADDLALHVLTFSQGAATLSNAFHHRAFVEREVERLEAWLAHRVVDNTPSVTDPRLAFLGE